jgi:hypothetical protein
MAPNPVIVNAFFDQLIAFLTELCEMYPDDADFSLGLTSTKMIRKINPTMWAKLFYENAKPYDSEITTKNEKFFMDHSFSDMEDLDFNILAKLKQYVQGMSDSSKKVVWIYVENLYKLGKIIAS